MDRFFRGLISGIAGGIAMNIWSYFSYHIVHFSTRRYLDWSSVILYGRLPHTVFEEAYALFIQILWVGLLGAIFTFLIREISTTQGLLIKGVFFGLISGFLIYGIPVMFGIQHLEYTPLRTVISNHIGGLIWGLTMAYTLKLLDKKILL